MYSCTSDFIFFSLDVLSNIFHYIALQPGNMIIASDEINMVMKLAYSSQSDVDRDVVLLECQFCSL